MPRLSEQRARVLAREILTFRGWDTRPVSSGGQLLEESEYRNYPSLMKIFEQQSKTGPGFGKPDFLFVESFQSLKPIIVIDTKPQAQSIAKAIEDTNHYGNAIHKNGQNVLCVAIAGAEHELCEIRVQRKIKDLWVDLTLHGKPIDWVPSLSQASKILSLADVTEVSPERPPDHVLAKQAQILNEIFRECKIKDEFRPTYAATFMLGLWYGDVSSDSSVVLSQINANSAQALQKAGRGELAESLRVDSENENLSVQSWKIIDILKKLNIQSFSSEHDYLGQLYETFFRYTGGNTIGQYFTPRHIIDMMCDLVVVSPDDVVFDPACGTGGFLIGALKRMIKMKSMSYEDAIKQAQNNIYGMESEPATAALCTTNMILRGDGKSGVIRKDCFMDEEYPNKLVDIALLNPPFPHKKTDTPPTKFIDRALRSVRHKGMVASVVPYSLLLKTKGEIKKWQRIILKTNRLLFVATMPPDLFKPYASFNTAVIVIQKGIPNNGSKTFFARLANDGYKTKKNIRVPQCGSQIKTILEAYDSKKEMPELTSYSHISEDTPEWSPEAFIKGKLRKDTDFIYGLEQSIRQQAAFYVSYGYRLANSEMLSNLSFFSEIFSGASLIDLSNIKMGRFKVGDYFNVTLGGKDEIEDLEDGSTPFVSTSKSDNGITTWCSPNNTYPPKVITVATDGSTCSSFVQEFPFYAFYKVAILQPWEKESIPVDALYFVAYLLKCERWRYVYARKFGKARINNTFLYAPIKENDNPDFECMGELVQKCIGYKVIAAFRSVFEKNN